MSQQTDALMGRFEKDFEDPNAGVVEQEPEEAGPGVVGKILTSFGHVKEKVSGKGSTPTTPSGVESQQDQSKVRGDLEGIQQEQSPPDQVHNDAVGLDTAGAGRPVGDGVERSLVGGLSPGGSSRSVDSVGNSARGIPNYSRDGGTPASPKLPRKGLGEMIIDKLPGSHMNPYTVPSMDPPQAPNSYVEGDRSAVPISPSSQRSSAPSTPSLLGRLKNLMTGQKPVQGTATDNATTGTAGTTAEHHGYTQSPNPEKSGDMYERAKTMVGHKSPDARSAETWPSPSKPDVSSIPSATRNNAEGQPIEGPTQPTSEDTKKEGLMTKLMDKLHIHEKNTSPRATTADIGKGTPPGTPTGTARTREYPPPTRAAPTHETGIPSATAGGTETTVGCATGPTEN